MSLEPAYQHSFSTPNIYARPWNCRTRHGFRPVLAGQETPVDAGPTLIRSPQTARLEAVLFVADSPLTPKKLFEAAKLIDAKQCVQLIDELNEMYDAENSPFRIEQIASGYQLLTRPEYSQWLGRVHQRTVELKLTPPTLETLTIIAYRQPITRADVEAIRGVQCSDVIKQLMERQLIRIGGEEDSLGRPYLYETTKAFLQYMGIRRINQLPNYEELRKPASTSGDSTGKDDNEEEAAESAPAAQKAS
ncbi:SMC-Scp complex subunit ScpB [bacterium]|nr:SMC-Scp complex subunit ScpB [bacterium]